MTMNHAARPQPLCAVFATRLPLLSAGELAADEALATQEHLAGCAWCRNQLAAYDVVDDALRRHFGAEGPVVVAAHPPDTRADERAFTLEDIMNASNQEANQQATVTRRSDRFPAPRRHPNRHLAAFSALAAVLLIGVVAAAIFAHFGAQRPQQAATTTPGRFTRFALSNPNTRVVDMVVGKDGSLCFTEAISHGNKIGHITPDGQFSEFPLPSYGGSIPDYLAGLAIGKDDSLWFAMRTSADGNVAIVHMTPDRAKTLFPLAKGVNPSSFITDPDGSIRFLASGGENTYQLGRVTPQDTITYVPIGTFTNRTPINLCLGPDGALWFTEFRSKFIGRVTLDGKLTEFPAPHSGLHIVAGPDGNLWYTSFNFDGDGVPTLPGVIGRITPQGAVTEYPLDPKIVPNSITAGPDGALWFSTGVNALSDGALGRITTDDKVSTIPIGQQGVGDSIAAGARFLWIAGDDGHTVFIWRYQM